MVFVRRRISGPCGSASGRAAMAGLIVASMVPLAAVAQTDALGNVAESAPPLVLPEGRSCSVPLFARENFGDKGENTRMDGTPKGFEYTPPAACPGPWKKVVLQADFSVDPGHQYDRTASIWLGGVSLYFGTTQEPSDDVAPSWRVERDLTDYAALLMQPGRGTVLINNWIDKKRASVLHANARLVFFPENTPEQSARPDAVLAISDGRNAPTSVQDGGEAVQRLVSLPRNVERLELDLIAQSQFHDEFWYMCLPDAAIARTAAFAMKRGYKGAPKKPRACGGGAFREVEVLIDGHPAGRAPVYPWIYTGGLFPHLWRPTPGLETLNFRPYRMDLTPFAGMMDDGKPHLVAVRVPQANHYFSLAAALLVFQDKAHARLSGSVTKNTLEGPTSVMVADHLKTRGGMARGNLTEHAKGRYEIAGYVDTPEGRITTRVTQTSDFANGKTFSGADAAHLQEVMVQRTHTEDHSTVIPPEGPPHRRLRLLDYALDVTSYREVRSPMVHFRRMAVRQGLTRQEGNEAYSVQSHQTDNAMAEGTIDMARAQVTASGVQKSEQSYAAHDTRGAACARHVAAEHGRVTHVSASGSCPPLLTSP